MRLTKKDKTGYTLNEHYGMLTTGLKSTFNKLGQVEDIEELCKKIVSQPMYEKFFKADIYELDYTGHNAAYDFKNNCIIVYLGHGATIYSVDEYGKTWALTREEL